MSNLLTIPTNREDYHRHLIAGVRLMLKQAEVGRKLLGVKYEDYSRVRGGDDPDVA